jgi:hypothetical protein
MRRPVPRLHVMLLPIHVAMLLVGCSPETWRFDADAAPRCDPNGSCARAGQYCDLASGQCVACVEDEQCAEAGLPRCDKALHQCVECGVDGDCSHVRPGTVCDSVTLRCVTSCADGGPCPLELPRCDPSTLQCVSCLTSSDCSDEKSCNAALHICIGKQQDD